ncbi:uncharacterized protein LOC110244477 [Exaiptasia diaphana]|uniref:Uncharacterized protein n=1 Tax=Exaiptasia diaphana TaxID=2652724 RepID=A0A913XLR5_EXADI|nr:uncharacterized protein LOC110244477 [Exaiptasia diaphana]
MHKENEPGESIYTEIPEHRNNGCIAGTAASSQELYSFAFENPDTAYNQTVTDESYEETASGINGRCSVTDEQGYIMPKEARGYNNTKIHKDRGTEVQNSEYERPVDKACNVLEGSKEQEYNVLEDPKVQEYNALEECKEQMYNVLEDPNEHNNGGNPHFRSDQLKFDLEMMNRRRLPTPPKLLESSVPVHVVMRPNRGRESSVNQGQDTSSVYEPLNDAGRPPSIYEPLNVNTLSRS